MNTPVSFEIAKLLKEKGYKTETCHKGWHGDFGALKGDTYPFLGTYTFFENFLTRNIEEHQIESPTIEEVVMWLYEKHGIWIAVSHEMNDLHQTEWFWIGVKNGEEVASQYFGFNSPTEAYSQAIEFTLKNLI